MARWKQQAANVTIIRDDWGIAHVHGKTDADAVFGMIYAQAEDDFNRVETNYINSLGRLAEAEGESAIWRDLRHEDLHRSRLDEGEVRDEPGVAEEADGRLGRRTELLSREASRGEAAGDHALRAVDGADVQRRQHRRRHREAISLAGLEAFYGKDRRGAARSRDEHAARPSSRAARTASPSRRRTRRTHPRCC